MFGHHPDVPKDAPSRLSAAAEQGRDAAAGGVRLSLVMPMAGRGSRFSRNGIAVPKPLIDLAGRPFFWWAAESVRRLGPLGELCFVVLEEHVRDHGIDEQVRRFYPEARIVALPEVTSGAAETAARGVAALASDGPLAICDSDHAFALAAGTDPLAGFAQGEDGALLCFESSDPAYSYVAFDAAGTVAGTVEKQAVSRDAIAGCYLFARRSAFTDAYQAYLGQCRYAELFVSGLYDCLLAAGGKVVRHRLARHVSFGTPEELARIETADFDPWSGC